MIGAVIQKEWTELRRDRRLLLLGGLLVALALFSAILGGMNAARHAADHRRAVEADQQIWRGQGEVNPHSAAHFGQYAFRPFAALGTFDPGLLPFLGQAVWIEAHYQNPAEARPAQANVVLQRFGDLSPAWILQTLAPLFVILAGFALVAGERERGALKLQVAQGLKPSTLVLGKTAGLLMVAALIVLPLVAVGAAAAANVNGFTGDMMLRTAVAAVAYSAYAAVWCALVVATSAMARSARQALVVLLGAWALSAVLVPRLAAQQAVTAYPVASAGAFWEATAKARAEGVDGHDSEGSRTKELQAQVLRKYAVSSMADLPVDFAGIALQAGEDYGNKVFDTMYGKIAAQEERQAGLMRAFSPLSPLLPVRALSSGVAGTDLIHQRDFTTAAERHRRKVQRQLNAEQTAHGKGANFNNTVGADFWPKVATFSYRQPTLASLAGRYAMDALILGLWLAASGGVLALAIRRLSTRIA